MSAAAIMANYHAAFATGNDLVEFPTLESPLDTEMKGDQAHVVDGRLLRPTALGIGVPLTPEMEARYPFDPSVIYSCALIDLSPLFDSSWKG